MVDVVDPSTRSRMMSGIRGKNTKPELLVRKRLHAAGFRFRIHAENLPGRPDVVLPKYRVAIFVHGCFWHGHSCRYFKEPKTNRDFWLDKIFSNKSRDCANIEKLLIEMWRVAIVWECFFRDTKEPALSVKMNRLFSWIKSAESPNHFEL